MATLTTVEILAYALASALYLGYLFTTRGPVTRVARMALGVGVVAQLVEIGVRCFARQNPVSSTPEAVALVAFLIACGTLVGGLRYKLAAAGAFSVPASLILLVLARVVPSDAEAPRMGPLGMVHILLATVGVAVFAFAAVLAVLYLVEEGRLRHRRFDRVGREAPLATLDRLALRCVSIGFPVFTVALVTGAIWIARLGGITSPEAHRPEYLLAVAAWMAFGVLLVARVGAGWRGRRAAWLTLGGFGGTLVVLVFYVLRYAV